MKKILKAQVLFQDFLVIERELFFERYLEKRKKTILLEGKNLEVRRIPIITQNKGFDGKRLNQPLIGKEYSEECFPYSTQNDNSFP